MAPVPTVVEGGMHPTIDRIPDRSRFFAAHSITIHSKDISKQKSTLGNAHLTRQ